MPFAPPVQSSSRMTSPFGVRASRRTGAPTFHAGVDFQASTGDPVYAVAPGTVRVVRTNDEPRTAPTGGYGNVIGIEHGDGTWTVYAHLSRLMVAEGETVTVGQQIAAAGSTSNGKFPGMGAHLHFEVRVPSSSGRVFPGPYRRFNVDPEAWLRERGIEINGGIAVSDRSGLGAATLAPDPAPHESDVGLPDEPVRDPSTYDPPSAGLVSAIAGAGFLAAAGAGFLLWDATR